MKHRSLIGAGCLIFLGSVFWGTTESPIPSPMREQGLAGALIGGALIWIGLEGKKEGAPPGAPR